MNSKVISLGGGGMEGGTGVKQRWKRARSRLDDIQEMTQEV